MLTLQAKTRAGIEKTFSVSPEICMPFGFFTGERVATPKGSAFVVGVSDNDLYFFIDGDRGVSKWSSFRKAEFMRRGFKLLFSLRDFHLSPSSISSQFSASVHSVESDRVLTSSCCCCIGCVDQLEDNDDHENNKSDQLFVDHPPAYMATGRFHDGSDQQSSQSKALSSQNSSQTIEPEHLCADASQTLRLCHHHQSHYHAPALAPLMEQRCFSDVVFRVRDDRVPGDPTATTTIPAIRGILAARSDYFRSMFTNFRESTLSEVLLPDMTYSVTILIIEYLYTGRIGVTPDLAMAVTQAADRLMLTSLKEICSKILTKMIDEPNVFEILEQASAMGMTKLRQFAIDFVIDNFDSDAVRQNFKNAIENQTITAELMCELIDRQSSSSSSSSSGDLAAHLAKRRRTNNSIFTAPASNIPSTTTPSTASANRLTVARSLFVSAAQLFNPDSNYDTTA